MKMMTNFATAYGSRSLGLLRLMAFFGLIAVLVPVQFVYNLFHTRNPYLISQLFHRTLMRALGFRLRVHGTIASSAPTLFVANHASYLDIPVLSALIPASFVAKAEVSGWPLIGFLAKMQNTIFVERRSVKAEQQRNVLRAELEKIRSLIVFPEGTSTDGLKVLPFKSSLFSIAEEGQGEIGLMVQPVSVVCTCLDGLPITRGWRSLYAWYGDMTLVPHLWNVLKLGNFTVDVIFHPAVKPASFPDRKALSQYCHDEVARGIQQCLKGREFGLGPQKKHLPQLAQAQTQTQVSA